MSTLYEVFRMQNTLQKRGNQRHVQDSRKHLGWRALQQYLTAKILLLLLQSALFRISVVEVVDILLIFKNYQRS